MRVVPAVPGGPRAQGIGTRGDVADGGRRRRCGGARPGRDVRLPRRLWPPPEGRPGRPPPIPGQGAVRHGMGGWRMGWRQDLSRSSIGSPGRPPHEPDDRVDVGGPKSPPGWSTSTGRFVAKAATGHPHPGRAYRTGDRRGRHRAAEPPPGASRWPGCGRVHRRGTRQRASSRPTWPGAKSHSPAGPEDLIGLPVVVEKRRANASAWAEVRFGAARGHAHVVFVAVGTGIGAAIVLDGRLYRGQWGMAKRAGPLPGGARRPTVRMRQPRLLGAVRERQCPGQPRPASSPRRSPGAAVRLLQLAGEARRDHRLAGHPGRAEGDPVAARCFGTVGGWLGRGWPIWRPSSIRAASSSAAVCPTLGSLLLGPARAAFEKARRPGASVPGTRRRSGRVGGSAPTRGVGAPPISPGRSDQAPAGRRTDVPHTTAPSSGANHPVAGRAIRTHERSANPPTNAATAQNAAQLGTTQPSRTASSRHPGPPNSAAQAPLGHRRPAGAARRRAGADVMLVITRAGGSGGRSRRADDAGHGAE